MATNRAAGENTITTSSVVILTVGDSLVGVGARLVVTNTNTTTIRTLTVHVAQDGGAAATANQFFIEEPLTGAENRAFSLPSVLRPGAKVYVKSNNTGLRYDIGLTLIPQTVSATVTT